MVMGIETRRQKDNARQEKKRTFDKAAGLKNYYFKLEPEYQDMLKKTKEKFLEDSSQDKMTQAELFSMLIDEWAKYSAALEVKPEEKHTDGKKEYAIYLDKSVKELFESKKDEIQKSTKKSISDSEFFRVNIIVANNLGPKCKKLKEENEALKARIKELEEG